MWTLPPSIQLPSTFYLRQGLLLNSQFLILSISPAIQLASGIPSLPLKRVGYRKLTHFPGFWMDSRDPNASPHDCKGFYLWAVSPGPRHCFCWKHCFIILICTHVFIIFGMDVNALTSSILENWDFPLLFSSLVSTVIVITFYMGW